MAGTELTERSGRNDMAGNEWPEWNGRSGMARPEANDPGGANVPAAASAG